MNQITGRMVVWGWVGVMAMCGGCQTFSANKQAARSEQAKADQAVVKAAEEKTKQDRPTIRIDAGVEEPVTDSQGVKWQADSGYDEGTPVDRPELQITGTKTPELYRTERYSMESYSFKVPNGKYMLKLHFSEDYEGITDPNERLFTYAVKDGDPKSGKTIKEVKDFSPWKAAGAAAKAYIDSVPVNVTNGQISIAFTPQVENPQINAIEIIPE